MSGYSYFDGINNTLGQLTDTVGNAFDAATSFTDSWTKFRLSRDRLDNVDTLEQYERGGYANDYADVPGTRQPTYSRNTGSASGLNSQYVQWGILALGAFAIYKVAQ